MESDGLRASGVEGAQQVNDTDKVHSTFLCLKVKKVCVKQMKRKLFVSSAVMQVWCARAAPS